MRYGERTERRGEVRKEKKESKLRSPKGEYQRGTGRNERGEKEGRTKRKKEKKVEGQECRTETGFPSVSATAKPASLSAAARSSSGPEAIRMLGSERCKPISLSPQSDSNPAKHLVSSWLPTVRHGTVRVTQESSASGLPRQLVLRSGPWPLAPRSAGRDDRWQRPD